MRHWTYKTKVLNQLFKIIKELKEHKRTIPDKINYKEIKTT